MIESLKNRTMTSEEVAHDLTLEVVRTSLQAYQQGNDYQATDVDIARYAVIVYDDCYPKILGMVEK